MSRLPIVCSVAIAQMVALPSTGAQECRPFDVSAEDIRAAMRLHGDYDIRATMNSARFGAEVILRLARQARARDPMGGPLLIRHDAWFDSYLRTAGITAEQAPIGARMAFRYRQDMQVEYRTERVIADSGIGPAPALALRIKAWMPDVAGTPPRYTYSDTLSVPKIRVTMGRVVTFYLLDYGDRVVYDRMSGISGRPTSGALGALFAVLGDARIEGSQIGIADDGVWLLVARAKWLFSRTATATIQRDGRGDEGVPNGRPDLKRLESRLRRSPSITYAAATC